MNGGRCVRQGFTSLHSVLHMDRDDSADAERWRHGQVRRGALSRCNVSALLLGLARRSEGMSVTLTWQKGSRYFRCMPHERRSFRNARLVDQDDISCNVLPAWR
jgi:hypothetical protein